MDVLRDEGLNHGESNKDRKSPSSNSERYTKLLDLLQRFRNTILETTEQLKDVADTNGYDAYPERRRNGKTEIYRTIRQDLLVDVEVPDPIAGINANWKVVMEFYKVAEKELLEKIDTKTAETESRRQMVSIMNWLWVFTTDQLS